MDFWCDFVRDLTMNVGGFLRVTCVYAFVTYIQSIWCSKLEMYSSIVYVTNAF